MVTIVELSKGHYEVREGRQSRSYVWHPGCVEVECECGERLNLTVAEEAVCECGRDHSGAVRERLERLREERAPWRGKLGDELDRSERQYWAELNELD